MLHFAAPNALAALTALKTISRARARVFLANLILGSVLDTFLGSILGSIPQHPNNPRSHRHSSSSDIFDVGIFAALPALSIILEILRMPRPKLEATREDAHRKREPTLLHVLSLPTLSTLSSLSSPSSTNALTRALNLHTFKVPTIFVTSDFQVPTSFEVFSLDISEL